MHTNLPLNGYNRAHIKTVNGGLSRLAELYPAYKISSLHPSDDFFFYANATHIGNTRISVRDSAPVHAENFEDCFLCKLSSSEIGGFSYNNSDFSIKKGTLIVGDVEEKYSVSSSGVSFMMHLQKRNLVEFAREFRQFDADNLDSHRFKIQCIDKNEDNYLQIKKLMLHSLDICDMFSDGKEIQFAKEYAERIFMFKLLEHFLASSGSDRQGLKSPSSRNHISKAIEYIDEFSDQSIISADIASYIGVSNRYLQKIFREELGMTPSQAIRNRRLELAFEALRQGGANKSVRDIALRYGFTNVGGFAGLIRAKYGRRPLDILRFG